MPDCPAARRHRRGVSGVPQARSLPCWWAMQDDFEFRTLLVIQLGALALLLGMLLADLPA